MKLLSRVRLFATPWTVAYQAPLSMGFSRREYWSGFPFTSPGDLPNPVMEPRSPALQTDTLPSEPPGKPYIYAYICIYLSRACQVAQMVKCLSAMRKTQVQSLGWEDPLEKEMATHSSVLAWRIPGTAEPGGLSSMGSHRVGHD